MTGNSENHNNIQQIMKLHSYNNKRPCHKTYVNVAWYGMQ